METKMKALVLDGGHREDSLLFTVKEAAQNVLSVKNYAVESVILRDLNLSPCKGCFDCWMKTPGICGITDAGRDIAEKAIKSNLLVMVTPVTFGGYSSELKKVRDRMIPLILPHFTKVYGETHHKPRYHNFPDLVGIGMLPDGDRESEEIFKTLVRRNAMQHPGIKYSAGVIKEKQGKKEITARIGELFSNMEAPSA